MIYVIKAVGTQYVKIGRAADPIRRLKQMQTGVPMQLVLLAVSDWPSAREKVIHVALKPYHVRGEWFTMCQEIFELVNAMQAGALTLDQWQADNLPPHRLARVLSMATQKQ
jgi:hypothetical protein